MRQNTYAKRRRLLQQRAKHIHVRIRTQLYCAKASIPTNKNNKVFFSNFAKVAVSVLILVTIAADRQHKCERRQNRYTGNGPNLGD